MENGIETATFHILTPYPGTGLYRRMESEDRLIHSNWSLYDTRHVVFQPLGMSATELEQGYWRAYERFYSWSSIFRGASTKTDLSQSLRHMAYAGGWKKFEPVWDQVIRLKRVRRMMPLLEAVLSGYSLFPSGSAFADEQSDHPGVDGMRTGPQGL